MSVCPYCAEQLSGLTPSLGKRCTCDLREAISLIRVFHGEAGWDEYQSSPEMKRLAAALSAADGKTSPPLSREAKIRNAVADALVECRMAQGQLGTPAAEPSGAIERIRIILEQATSRQRSST